MPSPTKPVVYSLAPTQHVSVLRVYRRHCGFTAYHKYIERSHSSKVSVRDVVDDGMRTPGESGARNFESRQSWQYIIKVLCRFTPGQPKILRAT